MFQTDICKEARTVVTGGHPEHFLVCDGYFFISPLSEARGGINKKAVFFFENDHSLILGRCKLMGDFYFTEETSPYRFPAVHLLISDECL